MLKHLPNTLTSANLLSGCLGIITIFQYPDIPAAWFIWAAATFDFFDGFSARMLKVSSAIGKELDSLADVVSFGVLPALIMYNMIDANTSIAWLPFIALLIAVCSALRLAIFNVDEKQSDAFIGLPTPANALFLSSLPLLNAAYFEWVHNAYVLSTISILFSFLLVAPIPLMAMKFKSFQWKGNEIKFTFAGLAVLLTIILRVQAIPLIILLYILLSFFQKETK